MITIIDYGMGNLGSIYNMFKRIKVDSEITGNIVKIEKAKKILLPGVGSFDKAISIIDDLGLREILNKKAVIEKIPFLGVCLGMQLLTDFSEEGNLQGLCYISAKTIKFKFSDNHYKIPHMGWNSVKLTGSNALIRDLPEEPRFYFVHSYYVKVEDKSNTLLKTMYGGIEFDSAIAKDNIYGVQFHPEKSHRYGMKLLENFARI
ncbi:MAG: imidazole glycerol phosphate synthase subunit HisH [Bacteroidota bacterium]